MVKSLGYANLSAVISRSTKCMREKRTRERLLRLRHVVHANRPCAGVLKDVSDMEVANLKTCDLPVDRDVLRQEEHQDSSQQESSNVHELSSEITESADLDPVGQCEIPYEPVSTAVESPVIFDEDVSQDIYEGQNLPVIEDSSLLAETKILVDRICKCVKTTVGDVVYMVLTLGIRHDLTWSAQVDILKMIDAIFDLPDKSIPLSRKSLLQKICDKDLDITFHSFCPDCDLYLGDRTQGNEKWSAFCYKCEESCISSGNDVNIICPKCESQLGCKDGKNWFISCFVCQKQVQVLAQTSFFLSMSLESQMRDLLEKENVADLLTTHRFSRKKINPGALEDIYDGEEYQKHFHSGGILSMPYNCSISFSTDGVATGKSNMKTMWPIYAKINELPYKERMKHTFLCGLYIGPKDPNQSIFLNPFVKEVNKLATEGFSWKHQSKVVTSIVIPLCAVVDSVARFQVLNMQSFHGFNGCTYCYQKQERTIPRKRRFNMVAEPAPLRTPESTREDAVKAFERRNMSKPEDRVYQGVKGPTVLMKLKYFNIIWGFSIDYLHALLLGVAKTHMKYLFEASRKKFWVGVTDRVALSAILKSIDTRLLTITPPTCITRTPRSITMWKQWKASEWRSWILFYCIPCLDGILKEKYLVHLALFCKALHISLKESITMQELDEVHFLLMEYGTRFQDYFHLQDTVYNLHLLTHVKKCILCLGPLWAHNTFCYEGQNRHLLQLYKSPNNVLLQIARRYIIHASMPFLVEKLVSNYEYLEYCEEILSSHLVNFVRTGKVILTDRDHVTKLTDEKCALLALHGFEMNNFTMFKIVLCNGFRFTTASNAHGKLNNNSIVVSHNNCFFIIRHILMDSQEKVVLLCDKLKLHKTRIMDNEVKISHIRKVKSIGQLACLLPSEIKCQGIILNVESTTFVTEVPKGCLGD